MNTGKEVYEYANKQLTYRCYKSKMWNNGVWLVREGDVIHVKCAWRKARAEAKDCLKFVTLHPNGTIQLFKTYTSQWAMDALNGWIPRNPWSNRVFSAGGIYIGVWGLKLDYREYVFQHGMKILPNGKVQGAGKGTPDGEWAKKSEKRRLKRIKETKAERGKRKRFVSFNGEEWSEGDVVEQTIFKHVMDPTPTLPYRHKRIELKKQYLLRLLYSNEEGDIKMALSSWPDREIIKKKRYVALTSNFKRLTFLSAANQAVTK